jgi:predicted adenine nucleotide alpha hydrolase (AANH) superfamily ATPase
VGSELLLHICCGPCASASITAFQARGADVTGFFVNPNIHPLLEFRRRLTGAREATEATGVRLVEDPGYDPAEWFARVAPGQGSSGGGSGEGGSRCARCIAHRLDRTASEAATRGCAAFSTTLSISPWQDQEAIRAGGRDAAERHGVEFVYEDLRPLYPESRRLSREWGLYRQKYCGCLLSEWERYRDA